MGDILRRKTTYLSTLGIVAIIAMIVPLLRYAYIGRFVRFMANDYCTTSVLHLHGFWATQSYWYQGWTGRFSFTAFISIAEVFGMASTKWLPLILIALFIVTATWATYQLCAKSTTRSFIWLIWSTVVALSLTLAVFALTPNLIQSFYWQTGGLTYFAPLITFLVTTGLIAHGPRAQHQRLNLGLVGLLAIITAGFSESFGLMQIVVYVYGLTLCLVLYRNRYNSYIRYISTGLVGSIIGLTIVALSPGNKVRLAYFPPHQDVITITLASFQSTLSLCQHILGDKLMVVPLLAVLGSTAILAVIAASRRKPANSRPLLIQLFVAPLLTITLIMASCWPVYYGYTTHTTFPDRTIILSVFGLILGVLYLGYIAGLLLACWHTHQSIILGLLALMVVTASLWNSTQQTSVAKGAELQLRTYAIDWGLINPELVHPTKANMIVTNLPGIGGLSDLSPEPNSWFNVCVAKYYNIKSVKVR